MEKWLELPDLPSEDEEPIPPKQVKTESNSQIHSNQTPIRSAFNSNQVQNAGQYHSNHQMNNAMYNNMSGPPRQSAPVGPSQTNMGQSMGPSVPNFRQPSHFPVPNNHMGNKLENACRYAQHVK